MDNYIVSFVMAGGKGTRLEVLTRDRSKPAVGVLGHYRIFDFVATNVANSGISTMLVATQFEPNSLSAHIGAGAIWGFDGIDKRVIMLHPYEDGKKIVTFEGTADCVRKSASRIGTCDPKVLLILGGDHIYTMTYNEAINQHLKSNADITIMTNVVPDHKVSQLGIVRIDDSGRIVEFAEKPTEKDLIESFRLSPKMKEKLGIRNPELNFLASMGNYIFFWDRLEKFLGYPGIDFGNDIIPAIKENDYRLYAYVFDGYWRDVGLIQDYFDCNMEFVKGKPPINLLENRIRTYERHLPGPWISGDSSVQGTILSSGCMIRHNSRVKSSVLGYQVDIEEECKLDRCILLGASRNEFYKNEIRRLYTTRIGRGSKLKDVILDRNTWTGEGVDIGPHNGTIEERTKILQNIGLRPYRELPDGTVDGEFCFEPDSGILVIGKQYEADPKKPILPDGLKC
ncbi:hypothetical protein GF312_16730 [Candidatus Poribacteria bacterium]|nr:hypothetical protein [Candidatus Poribacteria bacterium]